MDNLPEVIKVKDFIKSECLKHGVKCDFRPVKYLKIDKFKCLGYFENAGKELVVSTNNLMYVPTMIHEYCHFTQWVEQCPAWVSYIEHDSGNYFDLWLDGENISNIDFHIRNIVNMELDNEKRSVKMIKKFGLENIINPKLYIRQANAYLLFYFWVLRTRKWYNPKKTPYTNPVILSACSPKFNMRYTDLSRKMLKVFRDEYKSR